MEAQEAPPSGCLQALEKPWRQNDDLTVELSFMEKVGVLEDVEV